ncbi:hypothetical protein D3C81_1842320 [compost metagenome]
MLIRIVDFARAIQHPIHIGETVRYARVEEALLRRTQLDDRINDDIVFEFAFNIIEHQCFSLRFRGIDTA